MVDTYHVKSISKVLINKLFMLDMQLDGCGGIRGGDGNTLLQESEIKLNNGSLNKEK